MTPASAVVKPGARLKHVAVIVAGQSPESDQVSLMNEGLPFLQGNAEFGRHNPVPIYQCDSAPKVAESGDVLISVRAPVGAVNVANQAYGIGRGLNAVRAKRIDNAYMGWLLAASDDFLNSVATGSTYSAITASTLGNLLIPIVESVTQRQIAAYLDRETGQIDELISKQEQLLTLLAERRQAVITQAVTRGLDEGVALRTTSNAWWPAIPVTWLLPEVNHHFTVTLGKMLDANRKTQSDDVDLPYIRAANIQESELRLDELNRMAFTQSEQSSLSLRLGDLVVVEGGAVGVNQVISRNLKNVSFQKTVNRVRPRRDASAAFLGYALDVLRYAGVIDMICNKSTIAHLTAEKLQKIVFPFPPLAEQYRILDHIRESTERIDLIASSSYRMIELLKERRQALISSAVTGKIDVRETA